MCASLQRGEELRKRGVFLDCFACCPCSIWYLPVCPIVLCLSLHTGDLYSSSIPHAAMSPAQIPVRSSCCCVNKQVLIWISRVTPMLVLLLALLTHASGPGTWHGHVEAPCCWEAPHAGTLLCDWRKPDWDEWALYIEQEAWGTALVRPLSHSLSLVLCPAPFLPLVHTHIQWDTGAMFVSPQPLFFFFRCTRSCHLLFHWL